MRTILQAIDDGAIDAQPTICISNNASSGAIAYAKDRGIPTRCLNAKVCGGEEAVDRAIRDALQAVRTDYVILSGYMKRIGLLTLAAFPDRIFNIHPSLLPAFGGEGMYGMNVHRAVLAAGVPETGATVHVVDEVYDHGRILAQVRVPVLPDDTEETIRARVAAEEGPLYVKVLTELAKGENAQNMLS